MFNIELCYCACTKLGKHYFKEPIALSCGHILCKSCVPSNEEKFVKCNICGKTQENTLNKFKSSPIVECYLNDHLDELIDSTRTQLDQTLKRLRKEIKETKDSINSHFDTVENEIDLKLESLKLWLDSKCKDLKNQLIESKEDYVRKIDDLDLEIRNGEAQLNTLESDMRKYEESLLEITSHSFLNSVFSFRKVKQTSDNLHKYDETVRKLTQFCENLSKKEKKFEFEPSNIDLDVSVIGKVIYRDPIFISLTNGAYRFQKLSETNSRPFDFCELPDERLLVRDYHSKTLVIYDKNFNVLKQLNKQEKVDYQPHSITTNFHNRIYVTDNKRHEIFSTDFDLNIIDTAASTPDNQLNSPFGICCHNSYLYVCDCFNKRIKVLREEGLKFERSHLLEFEPWYIKILNRTVCVRGFSRDTPIDNNESGQCIYFFNLPTFSLKATYRDHNGAICTVRDLYFYEFYYNENTIYFYNNDGTFKDKVELKIKNDVKLNDLQCITYFNNTFIISVKDFNGLIMF